MPASELVALLGSENRTPTIVPNTADANNFGSDTTPTIEFTATDEDGDDLRYEVEIDTVNTFDSQGGADNALSLSDNGALYKTTDQVDNNISFFCWIKKAADGSKDIFLNGNNGTYGEGFSFRLNSSNKLVIDLSYLAQLASSFDLTGDSDWHFVGFTRNSGTWKIYLDGASETVGTTNPFGISADEKIVVASKNSDGAIAYNFDGYIARVGYWQSVISDANIASLYAGALVSDIGGAYIDLPLNDSGAWGTNGGSGGNLTTDGTLTLASGAFDAIPGVPLLDKLSGSDSGFANTVSGGDTDPFNSGEKVSFTVQAGDALPSGTYYWRARAKDPSGSNVWSDWTTARSFSISSGTSSSDSRAAKTTGSAQANSARSAKTTGKDSANAARSAKTSGKALANDSRSAKTSGVDTISVARSAKVTGSDSANSSRSAKTTGIGGLIGSRAAKTQGVDTTFSARNANTTGKNGSIDSRSAKVLGYSSASGSMSAKAVGKDYSLDSRWAKLTGKDSAFRGVTAKTQGKSSGNDARSAKLSGKDSSYSSRAAEVTGKDQANRGISAKTKGSLDVGGNISAEVVGKDLSAGSVHAKLTGKDSAVGNRNVATSGKELAYSGISVSLRGQSIIFELSASIEDDDLNVSIEEDDISASFSSDEISVSF